MYYDYPENDEAYIYEGEYMFGNDMLVAPICKSDNGAATVDQAIWLPEGKWYEAMTGAVLDGNQVVTRQFSREQIPYYYREGAIIPLFPPVKHLNERPDTLIFQFAPGNSGEFSLYEDENNNNKYEENKCTFTKVTQTSVNNVSTYTVHPRTGMFDGMPSTRSFRFEILDKNNPESIKLNGVDVPFVYDQAKRTITVEVNNKSYNELPLNLVVNNN